MRILFILTSWSCKRREEKLLEFVCVCLFVYYECDERPGTYRIKRYSPEPVQFTPLSLSTSLFLPFIFFALLFSHFSQLLVSLPLRLLFSPFFLLISAPLLFSPLRSSPLLFQDVLQTNILLSSFVEDEGRFDVRCTRWINLSCFYF